MKRRAPGRYHCERIAGERGGRRHVRGSLWDRLRCRPDERNAPIIR